MSNQPETSGAAPSTEAAGFQSGDDAVGLAPLLTVAKGNPTPEELAALTAVVAALQSSGQPGTPSRRARRPRRPLLRPFVSHGPGAWRHTFR